MSRDAAIARMPRTRIQREKSEQILEAALEVFSTYGFRGSTLDEIAARAGLSKPNLLYYFDGKGAIHAALIAHLLDMWLEPLREMRGEHPALEEITAYIRRKLELAREFPRESRLFANEILQGAPHILPTLAGPLRQLVDEKAALIRRWIAQGQLAPVDPHHLIFSIWATTQHYADFDVQVRAVLGDRSETRFTDAAECLAGLFTRALKADL